MGDIRKIKKITKGEPGVDGAGVKLVRVIGYRDTKDYDPFLMMDAFDSHNPEDYVKGFPWHPHRGIETITYLIEGEIEHQDSLGNIGTIKNGDCQWMTAGSGIIHQEMPKPSKRMLGAQIWLNLPARYKMVSPKYGDIKHEDIPLIKEENSTVRIIAGDYKTTSGAFKAEYVKATYLDVEVGANSEWYYETEEDFTLFLYILNGEGSFEPDSKEEYKEKQAVLFDKGKRVYVKSKDKGIRFLMLSAEPLKEPIAWGGPIVMNTKDELNLAFRELDEERFIK